MAVAHICPTPSKPKTLWVDPLFWFTMALGLIAGGVFNVLLVTFPVFKRNFGASLEQMGRTPLVFFLGSLLFSAFGGWSIGRLGLRRAAAGAYVCLVIGLWVVGTATKFAVVLLGAFSLGLAAQFLSVVSTSLIAERFGDKQQSVFHIWGIIAAIGATAAPAALGWSLAYAEQSGVTWRVAYYAASGVPLALMAWGLMLRPKVFAVPARALEKHEQEPSHLKAILSEPTIYAVGAAAFLHGVAQLGMFSWVGPLYQKKLNIDAGRAAYFISLNQAGFFAGRSLLGWLTARWRIHELVVLGACAGLGTLAFVTTIISPNYALGLIAFTLAGVFISGDGPALSAYTGRRFAGRSATAFALSAGVGSAGAAIGPYLTGLMGSRLGLEKAIWFMPAFGLGLAGLAFGWFFKERARQSVP